MVGGTVIVYHRTDAAAAILAGGFRDRTGMYLTTREWSGVWVSDRPLDANAGAVGDALIMCEIPDDLFAEFEWIEDGKGYRESLIPAARMNAYPDSAKVVDSDA